MKRGSSKLDSPDKQQLVYGLMAAGATQREACRHAGITEKTFITWKQKKPEEAKEAADRAGRFFDIRAFAALADLLEAGEPHTVRWYIERRIAGYRRQFAGDSDNLLAELPVDYGEVCRELDAAAVNLYTAQGMGETEARAAVIKERLADTLEECLRLGDLPQVRAQLAEVLATGD